MMEYRRLVCYAPLALAIATAAVLQAVHVVRTPTISADGIIFIKIARALPDGFIETLRREDQHPGYPAMLLGATRIVQWLGYQRDPESWARGGIAVAYLCGLGCVVAVWLLARELFDARVANIAAFVFAVLPVPCWSAADAHSDTPHLLAYLTAAWLAASGVASGHWLTLAGAGAVSALAYWIRPEGMEVFLVALMCLMWQAFRAHWTWRQTSLASAALAGAALLVAAPYPILAHKLTSKQLPFAKAAAARTSIDQVAATHPADPPPAVPNLPAQPGTTAAASADSLDNPPRYSASPVLKLLGKAVVAFLNSICQGFKFVFIPLYLIGHVECARRKPDWLQIALLALLGVAHFLALLAVFMLSGYIAHRHVLPLVGLAMPFTALGIIYVGEVTARGLNAKATYVVPGLLAVCCACVVPFSVRALNREFLPVIAATKWVEEHAPPGSGIVCNSPYVEFYGTLPVAYLGNESQTLDAALSRAPTEARFDYVVLHVNAHAYRPEWIDQLAPYYHQVCLFPDPWSVDRPKKVLVFQANEGHVRRPEPNRSS